MAQKIDVAKEAPGGAAATDLGGPLHFEGSVDLGGAVSAQQLGVLFGPEATVIGKLRFDGAVTIDGRFRGSIRTNDQLVVGSSAVIEADIVCGSAAISGEVVGNITASDSVELQSAARVKGDITSPSLSVQRGVVFDGASRMAAATKARRR